jgi:primosomal protein N'
MGKDVWWCPWCDIKYAYTRPVYHPTCNHCGRDLVKKRKKKVT